MKTAYILLTALLLAAGAEAQDSVTIRCGNTERKIERTYPILTLPGLPPRSKLPGIGEWLIGIDSTKAAAFDSLLLARLAAFDSLLLARLVEYKTECYNDNTALPYCPMCGRFNDYPGTVALGVYAPSMKIYCCHHCGAVFARNIGQRYHRPVTFEGFMGWLGKRKGENEKP